MKHKNWIGFFLTVVLIASALGLQITQHLTPCPLCIMQRLAFITIGLLFLLFALLPQRMGFIRMQGVFLTLVSAFGLAVALRQIYLQHLPKDQVPACGPGLHYLLQLFPWSQALSLVFQGSGECAVIDWRFLGLSMASWSALWLLFFCMWGIWMLWKKDYTKIIL